jgi:hypothetical protein
MGKIHKMGFGTGKMAIIQITDLNKLDIYLQISIKIINNNKIKKISSLLIIMIMVNSQR